MEKPWRIIFHNKAGILSLFLLCIIALNLVSCQPKQKQMDKRSSIKGVLYDGAGMPVKDAIVMISDGPAPHNDIASVTNDSGEFYLSNIVVPGRYTLQINSGGNTIEKEVTVNSDEVLQLQY